MMAGGDADIFQIVVFAAGARALLAGCRFGVAAVFQPQEGVLNCTMPALVKSSVGSSLGISDELATTVCPLLSKYFKNYS